MDILYEDNHLIIVNKRAGDIVQGDKTGDVPLSELIKEHIKQRDQKPGNVFLGVVHRLDRPVSGVCLFAKTSKALARMNAMFARHELVKKTYWALVGVQLRQPEAVLKHWLTRDEKRNVARAYDREVPNSKFAELEYRTVAQGERYWLLEIDLHTGRHHQIRCQLSKMGCPIKGDLKYGAPRSNPDGSISLHARRLCFEHPVTHEQISVEAPVPTDRLWQAMEQVVQ